MCFFIYLSENKLFPVFWFIPIIFYWFIPNWCFHRMSIFVLLFLHAILSIYAIIRLETYASEIVDILNAKVAVLKFNLNGFLNEICFCLTWMIDNFHLGGLKIIFISFCNFGIFIETALLTKWKHLFNPRCPRKYIFPICLHIFYQLNNIKSKSFIIFENYMTFLIAEFLPFKNMGKRGMGFIFSKFLFPF